MSVGTLVLAEPRWQRPPSCIGIPVWPPSFRSSTVSIADTVHVKLLCLPPSWVGGQRRGGRLGRSDTERRRCLLSRPPGA